MPRARPVFLILCHLYPPVPEEEGGCLDPADPKDIWCRDSRPKRTFGTGRNIVLILGAQVLGVDLVLRDQRLLSSVPVLLVSPLGIIALRLVLVVGHASLIR